MVDFNTLKDTPLPIILIAFGALLLLIGLVSGTIEISGLKIKGAKLSLIRQIVVAVIGSLFMLSGMLLYLLPPLRATSPAPTPTATLTPLPTPVNTTALSPEQAKMQYLHIINTTTPILSDSLTAQDSNAWDTYSNTSFGCGFGNGAYHAFTFQPNVDAECLAKATNFSNNFVYQVKMTTTKGEGGGIIFGSENGTSIKYRFFVNTGTYCDLFVPLNNQRLFDNTHAPINSGLNQPNLIAVMVLSNAIYLFINQQYIGMARTRDGGPLFGQIGLFAVEIGKPTDVVFSELNVWL